MAITYIELPTGNSAFVNSDLNDGFGNPISSTAGGGKRGLDINVNSINSSAELFIEVSAVDGDNIAIKDVTGTNALVISAAGAAKVDGSAVTQPVSVASLPLPSNAAFETGGNLASLVAKDFATQTTLALIKAKTDNLDVALSTRAVTGLTDTQLRATAVPVSIASLPLPSNAATEAKQDSLQALLDSVLYDGSGGIMDQVIGLGANYAGGFSALEMQALQCTVDSELFVHDKDLLNLFNQVIVNPGDAFIKGIPVMGQLSGGSFPALLSDAQAFQINLRDNSGLEQNFTTNDGQPNVRVVLFNDDGDRMGSPHHPIAATLQGEALTIGTINAGLQVLAPVKETYSAFSSAFTPPATPTDVFTITGVNGKTIKIYKMFINTTQTVAGINIWSIVRRSTANSGGTATTITSVQYDSSTQNLPANAVIKNYTANPTLGTSLGIIWRGQVASPVITSLLSDTNVEVDFELMFGKPLILVQGSDVVSWNFGGAALPTGLSVIAGITWTEE